MGTPQGHPVPASWGQRVWRVLAREAAPLRPPLLQLTDGEGFLRSSLGNGHYCSINEGWDADMRDALLSSSRRSQPAPTSGDPPPHPWLGKLWGLPRTDLLSRRDTELGAQRGMQRPAFPFAWPKPVRFGSKAAAAAGENTQAACPLCWPQPELPSWSFPVGLNQSSGNPPLGPQPCPLQW